MKKKVAVLGSTGSIGTQTIDVISHNPDLYEVVALAAGRNIQLLQEQVERFRPRIVTVADSDLADRLRPVLPGGVQVMHGEAGLVEAAAGTGADVAVNALVGSQGLMPTLAAIEAGVHIGLANKETIVCAGHLVTAAADKRGVKLLPIDSEHSALFQCLNGESAAELTKMTITASGGSFRDRTRDQLAGVTLEEALRHPNWSMGVKNTIDSATMVNKGLEVIEAHWLFGVPYEKIEVVLHPESIVHAFVEFADRTVIAHLSQPDMRIPIQYALTYPSRLPSPAEPLSIGKLGKLHFRDMDYERFPCLRIAFECGQAGGSATTVFNAANEVAVSRFVDGEIEFLHIEEIIGQVVAKHEPTAAPSFEDILEYDRWARDMAASVRFG